MDWRDWKRKKHLFHRIRNTMVALLLVLVGFLSSISSVQASGLTLETTQKYGKMISAGAWHSMALKSDGTVAAWGYNWAGQTNVPAGVSNVISIAAGGNHSMALKSDGTVAAWGWNYYGETNVPAGLSNVVEIAAGGAHCLALKSDGTVVAWGLNNYGQTNVPAGLNNVVAIAAGDYYSMALKSDGTVVAWGGGDYHLGQTNVPAGLSNVVAIAAGGNHSMALKSDGTVVAWGDNNYGKTNIPAGLSNVVAIAAGYNYSMALKSDGTIVSWGDNQYGQCNVPVGVSNVVAIAAGYYHSMALKSDGTVIAWGRNLWGQTNVPAGLLDNTPPVTTDNAPKDWVNNDVTVNLTATDNDGSGIASTYYQVDNGSTQSGNVITISSEGVHTLTYWSVDNDGNVEAQHTATVKIDKTAPVTALSTNPGSPNGNNGWYISDVQVSLNPTDLGESGVANTEYRVNGGAWTTYNGALTLSSDETYTIDYRSTDNAGNIEQFNTKTIKLDKTAPTLNISLDKTTLWPANHKLVPVTTTNNASDSASGIDSVVLISITSNETLQSDDIQNANYNVPITGSTDSFELRADRSGNGNGRVYTITYSATDAAGNVIAKSVNVSVPHDLSNK